MAVYPPTDVSGNISAHFCSASNNSGAPSLVTAAGTGDNTAVTGTSIDRFYSGTTLASSALVVINYLAALDTDETISFTVTLQDSDDNSTWNTAVALGAKTVAHTGTGTNHSGVQEASGSNAISALAVNLESYGRYVRFNVTPDLSRAGTDTAVWGCVAILSGYGQYAK